MRILIVIALLAGCASKKAPTTPANTAPAPAAAEPKKDSKESTDKDSAPTETKRKSDPCEGGQ
jgi:PBP1b-binding outer membrane lipoprotein LpoB